MDSLDGWVREVCLSFVGLEGEAEEPDEGEELQEESSGAGGSGMQRGGFCRSRPAVHPSAWMYLSPWIYLVVAATP